jgi:hypothetical protein
MILGGKKEREKGSEREEEIFHRQGAPAPRFSTRPRTVSKTDAFDDGDRENATKEEANARDAAATAAATLLPWEQSAPQFAAPEEPPRRACKASGQRRRRQQRSTPTGIRSSS